MANPRKGRSSAILTYTFNTNPVVIDLDANDSEDSALDPGCYNDGYDSDETVRDVDTERNRRSHNMCRYDLKNPDVEADISYSELASLDHNGAVLRARKTVELTDGDFLRITSIIQHRTTNIIRLRGHIFRRCFRIDNMLPKKKNEVAWLQDHDRQDPRDISRQSLHTVELCEVIKIRQLILTNQPYPLGSFRDDVSMRTSDKDYILDHGRLICRWKVLEYSHTQGSIIAVSEAEANSNHRAICAELRKAFRGHTTAGGACPRWLEGEREFDAILHGDINQRRYTFGDAFCGAGGMSQGAKIAGLRVDWGFDFDPAAIRSYSLNFYRTRCEAIAAHEFAVVVKDDFKVDVLHLSPPCQYFSPIHVHAGKDDEMNQATFLAVEELLKKTKPRIVTLEETFGLTRTLDHQQWFHTLIMMFTKLGFSVRWNVFRLVEFGLPQVRKRLIIFAACPGERLPEFPDATHCSPSEQANRPRIRPYLTVNDAISHIPDSSNDPLHNLAAATKRNDPPYDGNKPLNNTITCSGTTSAIPSGTRSFTLREVACLQGFPLEHRFGKERIRKQIGNAVPPVVAKVFLEAVIKALRTADGIVET